jgi:hypothetical protein
MAHRLVRVPGVVGFWSPVYAGEVAAALVTDVRARLRLPLPR